MSGVLYPTLISFDRSLSGGALNVRRLSSVRMHRTHLALPGKPQSGNPGGLRVQSFPTPFPHESAPGGFEINILLIIHASAHVSNLNSSYSMW
jgi:hypothetical protein